MLLRQITHRFTARPTIEGAGVHLKRVFGYPQVPLFDPFLMLDDFHSANPAEYLPGFPWHPHRGIETITYLLEGAVEHGDSMGNRGVIATGDVQWMTAGSGIIHQEMPRDTGDGRMWGFQLWANLPAAQKMMAPRYRGLTAAELPTVTLDDGTRATVISGTLHGVTGPVRDIVIAPTFLDLTVPPATTYTCDVPAGHTAFAYVIDGTAHFAPDSEAASAETALLFDHAGDAVAITTGREPVRCLLLAGKPLGEPIAWRGPIVMNTEAELAQAFLEYQRGTFVR